MIKLVFMSDPDRVIGASDSAASNKRCDQLPISLMGEMCKLYNTQGAVLSDETSIMGLHASGFAEVDKFVFTQKANFKVPNGLPSVQPVLDLKPLIEQYQNSEEELLVIGGLSVFKQILPYADRLEVLEIDEPVAGDLVFTEWDNGDFSVTTSLPWDGGKTTFLKRQK
ncbi:dihydrofolate reductase [Marinomonas epiphytica]